MHAEVYEEVQRWAAALPTTPLRIADIGAYDVNGNLRSIFARQGWEYVGFDMSAGPNVDKVLPHSHEWPDIASATFDAVVCVSTLEHTLRPYLVVLEMARILKPGGYVCFTAPYAWPKHDHPIDCFRIYPDGMRAMMEDAGLVDIQTHMREVNSWHGDIRGGDTVGIGRRPL